MTRGIAVLLMRTALGRDVRVAVGAIRVFAVVRTIRWSA